MTRLAELLTPAQMADFQTSIEVESAARREDHLERLREQWEAAAAAIDACVLRDPTVRGLKAHETSAQGICYLDGQPLPKRRSRWCSEACANLFWRNHGWTTARGFALTRARLSLVVAIARWNLSELLVEWFPMGSWGLLQPRCERCSSTQSIEVNHVEPRQGGGYGNGCWNHQTNLEPLCHPCHVLETTAQRRERAGWVPGATRPRRPEPGIAIWDFVHG
jgi:5-methylcytosine-specific restriction endonuclease McrA